MSRTLRRGALEELDAEPVLQFEDDAADRRLGHGQAFGGAMEIEFLGHCHEGRQVLEVVAHIDSMIHINGRTKSLFHNREPSV